MQQPPSMTTKKYYLEDNFASKVQACKNLKAVLIVFCWESRKFCKFGRNISLGWDKFKSAPQSKDDIFQLKAAHRNWPMMCSAWWGQCAWYQRIRPGLADLLLPATAGAQNSELKKLFKKYGREKMPKKSGPRKKYKSIRAGLVDLPLPLQGLRTQNRKKYPKKMAGKKCTKKNPGKNIKVPEQACWSAFASAGAQNSFPLQHFLNW